MTLEELIYKRFTEDKELTKYLTKFSGVPAVFSPEAPNANQEGWRGKPQYPKIIYNFDLQASEERKSAGTLYVYLLCQNTIGVVPEIIEPEVKKCLRDVILTPTGGTPYCFTWAKTDAFTVDEDKESLTIGSEIRFDIMEYPNQETTDPDPIVALSRCIKEIYPEAIVLGLDQIGEFTEAEKAPVIYCRIVTLDKVSGHNMNIVSWVECRIAVHLLCPDRTKNLKMLSAIMQKLSVEENVILLDGSPMVVSDIRMDMQSDYLKQGQLQITGRFGILKYREKSRILTANIITERRDQNGREETRTGKNRNTYRRESPQGTGGRSSLFVR